MAGPGQGLGPWSIWVRVLPSKMGCTSPIFGISMVPICTTGALSRWSPLALGAFGWGGGVVVGGGGSVVVGAGVVVVVTAAAAKPGSSCGVVPSLLATHTT